MIAASASPPHLSFAIDSMESRAQVVQRSRIGTSAVKARRTESNCLDLTHDIPAAIRSGPGIKAPRVKLSNFANGMILPILATLTTTDGVSFGHPAILRTWTNFRMSVAGDRAKIACSHAALSTHEPSESMTLFVLSAWFASDGTGIDAHAGCRSSAHHVERSPRTGPRSGGWADLRGRTQPTGFRSDGQARAYGAIPAESSARAQPITGRVVSISDARGRTEARRGGGPDLCGRTQGTRYRRDDRATVYDANPVESSARAQPITGRVVSISDARGRAEPERGGSAGLRGRTHGTEFRRVGQARGYDANPVKSSARAQPIFGRLGVHGRPGDTIPVHRIAELRDLSRKGARLGPDTTH